MNLCYLSEVLKVLPQFLIFLSSALFLLSGCETAPYAPPPTPAAVESVKIQVADFHGRPDIYADIRGRLTSNAALLVDTKQYRGKGNMLHVEVREQTPKGDIGTNRVPNPPFQTRVPLEVFGLVPGRVYVVDANGARTHFQMPDPEANEDDIYSVTSSTTTGLELPGF